jgi:hypothetical protein
VRLNDIAEKYAAQINFLCVYIKEAHADDEDQVSKNLKDGIIYNKPITNDERADIAAACMLRFNFSFPMVLDDMDDGAEDVYVAQPERLYVLDRNGIITWKCGLCPQYFDIDAYEEALSRMV